MVFTLGLRHTAVVCSSLPLVLESLIVISPYRPLLLSFELDCGRSVYLDSLNYTSNVWRIT